jgi:uncharacterized protein YcbK (DUF882 family)
LTAARWPVRAADVLEVRNDMGSRVPANSASEFLASIFSPRIAPCAGLVALIILLSNNGLENAVANGDTRTLSLHHIHTDEDITITYRRDGRYDEEALKRLDRFLRDWRKDEDVHIDPRLFDVIWEVSREVGGDKAVHVVCGYRSPSTNAMLRRRSSGVARFSQHTLGKAMDFFIPGAPLEELRDAGLRLQRGGVGYYPSSGSPFVHLDVGSVRHWPRMTHDQLARVFPNGRTVHVPSDGHPLSGYALALADIEKRGSSPPSQTSLGAAQTAGVDLTSARNTRKKSLLAALFHTDEDEDDTAQATPRVASSGAAASQSRSFNLAAADTKVESIRTVPVPAARPQLSAAPSVLARAANNDDAPASAGGQRDRWAMAALAEPLRPVARAQEIPRAPLSNPDNAPTLAPWPIRDLDKDRVPLHMVLAYAAQPQGQADAGFGRAESAEERSARAGASGPTRGVTLRENTTVAAKKGPARAPAAVPVTRVKVAVQVATPGMRYDDPWLRAMILAPRLYGSMTTTLYGEPDFTELRALMDKPTVSVAMSFTTEPYPGITANGFSGEAVVLLDTYAFSQRTAWLQ